MEGRIEKKWNLSSKRMILSRVSAANFPPFFPVSIRESQHVCRIEMWEKVNARFDADEEYVARVF